MKQVFVIRHGKSSWENPHWKDIERPLMKKGRKRTKKIAAFLKSNAYVPDLILSSHAKRALETAGILSDVFGGVPVDVESVIYDGNEEDLDDILMGLPEQITTVFIVGHNPDLTDWVNRFKEEKIYHFPTSAVFGVRFLTDRWEDVAVAPYEEILYAEPKKL